VASLWPRAALGASPKRADSALQPATPIETSTGTIARDHDRNNSIKEFMFCSLARNNAVS
jgi:hypothetical protein